MSNIDSKHKYTVVTGLRKFPMLQERMLHFSGSKLLDSSEFEVLSLGSFGRRVWSEETTNICCPIIVHRVLRETICLSRFNKLLEPSLEVCNNEVWRWSKTAMIQDRVWRLDTEVFVRSYLPRVRHFFQKASFSTKKGNESLPTDSDRVKKFAWLLFIPVIYYNDLLYIYTIIHCILCTIVHRNEMNIQYVVHY